MPRPSGHFVPFFFRLAGKVGKMGFRCVMFRVFMAKRARHPRRRRQSRNQLSMTDYLHFLGHSSCAGYKKNGNIATLKNSVF